MTDTNPADREGVFTDEQSRPMAGIKISQDHAGGPASVILDGTEINQALSGLHVDMAWDHATKITLDLIVYDGAGIGIQDAVVIVPKHTKAALKVLGWTEPGDES